MTADRLVSFADAAAMLGGISIRTIRRMIAARQLPEPVYVGRKPMLVLSELLETIERLKARRRDYSPA